jgi:hypothetical protein
LDTWLNTTRQTSIGFEFTKIDRLDAPWKQVLDYMWIYTYKFDKHGRLLKYKARLVVRSLQQHWQHGHSMAIAARFDLELQ